MKYAGGEKMSAATGKHHAPLSAPSDPDTINELIASLGDDDGLVRQRARRSLVVLGALAVPSLTRALNDPSDHKRWEAAKALGQIRDPVSAPALVHALEDRDFGVRWLVAEALIALDDKALAPLLEAMTRHSASRWLREGAHHVLRMLADKDLHDLVAPVLAALDGVEPVLEVPQAARAALDELNQAT
jgi:HEAT repeat protein